MHIMKTVALFVVVIALVALAGYFYKQSTGVQMGVTPTPTQTPAPTTESSPKAATGDVKEFTLEAGNFYFKPSEVRVKQGDKVRITINSVSMMHDLVIDELNTRTPIVQSGNTGVAEFTADTKGTFEFYCSVGQHRQNGMVGTLIVE
jgi:plastocyanin